MKKEGIKMKIEELIREINENIKQLEELYNYYLEKIDKDPYDSVSIERINSIRTEKRTYERVLRLIMGEADD